MASLRSINQDDLRNHNLSVVLDSLLRATEPMSRADLAKKTGLTKAAMSVLVSLMLDNEILVEGAPSGQSLYGRPSIPLEIRWTPVRHGIAGQHRRLWRGGARS